METRRKNRGDTYRLLLSPSEGRLYAASTGGVFYVEDLPSQTALESLVLSPGAPLTGLALSVDGATAFVASRSGYVSRLSTQQLRITAEMHTYGVPQDVILAKGGAELWSANESGWIDIIDAATFAYLGKILTPGDKPFGMAGTPDDAQVYVTSSATGHVLVIDRASRAILRTIDVRGVPRRVAFSNDGSTAFVANESGWIDVIR